MYMFAAPIRAFFPHNYEEDNSLEGIKEVNWRMTVPMVILAVIIIATGVYPQPVIEIAGKIAAGLI